MSWLDARTRGTEDERRTEDEGRRTTNGAAEPGDLSRRPGRGAAAALQWRIAPLRRGPGGKVATPATLPQSPRWEAGVGRVSPECQLAFRSMGQRTRAELALSQSQRLLAETVSLLNRGWGLHETQHNKA